MTPSKSTSESNAKRIRVLVIDDSSVARTAISSLLATDSDLEVIGTAPDATTGRDKLVRLQPDVITLDLNLPDIDGLVFLEKVMHHLPTPTVIVSSLSKEGSEVALRALALGAIDVILKPSFSADTNFKELAAPFCERVKQAARVKLKSAKSAISTSNSNTTTPTPVIRPASPIGIAGHQSILAIGSSTGGTEALKRLLPRLPPDLPGTVIVQHMPHGFTRIFADSLARICPFTVKEAQDGDRIKQGTALLAPGNFHMTVKRDNLGFYVALNQDPQIHGVRPAADILFQSIAQLIGPKATGVILTGMGRDGAAGLLSMHQKGAFTIAQDEATSVVFGMPKAAIEIGAVSKGTPIDKIADIIVNHWTAQTREQP